MVVTTSRPARLRAACQAFLSLGLSGCSCPGVFEGVSVRPKKNKTKQAPPRVAVLTGFSPPRAPLGACVLPDRCGALALSRAGPKPRQTRDGRSWRMGPLFSFCPRAPRSPSPLPAVAVRWGVRGGCVQAPARPRLPVFCLTALAGPGSPDAADTLACLPWLRVVRGPPRHGEGRPGAALLTRLGVLSALCAWPSVVPLERSRSSQVPEAESVASFPVPSEPPPSGHRCRWLSLIHI